MKQNMESDVRNRLEAEFTCAEEITVDVDGNRVSIRVIADVFEGLSRVERQKKVYRCIGDLIESGALHAVTIQAHPPRGR